MLGVVVPGRPAGVEAHVRLPLYARHVVVLGLLLPAQRVPLKGKRDSRESGSFRDTHQGRRPSPASASSSSGRSGSCLWRSSAGTSACAAAARRAPSRNTWPAPRATGRATKGGGKEGLVSEGGREARPLRLRRTTQHNFTDPNHFRIRVVEDEVSQSQSGIFCPDGRTDGRTDGTTPFGVIHMSHADKRRRNMILRCVPLPLCISPSLLTLGGRMR